MAKQLDLSILNDPKVEAVLAWLHSEAQAQSGQLFRHYLPQLPKMLLGKEFRWDNA